MIVYGRSNGKALRSALNSVTEVRNGYIYSKCRYVEYNMVYGQFQSVPQEESNSCHSNCDKEIFCHPLYEEDIRNQDKNYIPMCKPFRRFITKQKD